MSSLGLKTPMCKRGENKSPEEGKIWEALGQDSKSATHGELEKGTEFERLNTEDLQRREEGRSAQGGVGQFPVKHRGDAEKGVYMKASD